MKSTTFQSSISQLRRQLPSPMPEYRMNIPGFCMLLMLCSLWPFMSRADVITVTAKGPMYQDTSTLGPVTQSGGKNLPQYTTYCSWVLTGLQNAGFTTANNWFFTFAGADGSGFFQRDETTNEYLPYVVNQPNVRAPDGTNYPGLPQYQGKDLGGADFVMTYKPVGLDRKGNGLHWVHAFRESLNGGRTVNIKLDQPGNLPWYDDGGTAKMNEATLGGASWLLWGIHLWIWPPMPRLMSSFKRS
jgi:hypothetical protein